MSTTFNAISGMRAANSIIIQTSNNIANAETAGFKSGIAELYNIKGENGVSYLTSNTIDDKGSFNYTGIVTDLATNSNKAFFIAKNSLNSEIVNVATGSFRPNVNGQLEYLGKYVLLGVKYSDEGNLPGFNQNTIEPIVIDNTIESKAIASTQIYENFSLNSELLARGKASFVMNPSAANKSTSGKLDGMLQSSGDLQPGNGFMVQIQEQKNDEIITNSIKCIFQGAITSSSFSQTGNLISSGDPSDSIDIDYNGVLTSIPRSVIQSGNDLTSMTNIQNAITNLGLNATLISSGGNVQLSILPPNTTSDSLIISGTLATSLGITASIMPVQSGAVRFSSMKDLKEQLVSSFAAVDSNDASDSIILMARPNTCVTLRNLQGANVLGTLGMYAGPIIGQGYDPYDPNQNIASGNASPDIIESVSLYDSKGGEHILNVAIKKVEDGWIQEAYTSNQDELVGVRSDGLLQVTKFTFDTKGNLKASSGVVPTVTSKLFIDPFATISSTSGAPDTVSINGTTLTLGTDFNSYVGLVNAVNNNSILSSQVEATIMKNNEGLYNFKIISKNGVTPTIKTTLFGIESYDALPDASQSLILNFSTDLNIDNIKVQFNKEQVSESVHRNMSGSVTANGMGISSISSISIDTHGDLIGNFANGTNKKLYRIPIATYKNVNGLEVLGDSALKGSATSGKMSIVSAGDQGTGEILSGNIETSNVEQAEELTTLITTKQFYNMNTKSWQTGNAIIDYLLNSMN